MSKCIRLRRLAQNRVSVLGARHFSWKFSCKIALVTCPSARRLRRLAQSARHDLGARYFPREILHEMACLVAQARTACRDLGARHFSCKFSRAMALAPYPCVFRIRRLTQTARCDLERRHLSCIFCIKWLLWLVHVHFDCAGSHTMEFLFLGRGIFVENSCVKWHLWHVHVHFDRWRRLTQNVRRGFLNLWTCCIFTIFKVNSRIKNGVLWRSCCVSL